MSPAPAVRAPPYCVFVLLHAFVKRTSKTPEREIEIAKARLADYAKREDQQKR